MDVSLFFSFFVKASKLFMDTNVGSHETSGEGEELVNGKVGGVTELHKETLTQII